MDIHRFTDIAITTVGRDHVLGGFFGPGSDNYDGNIVQFRHIAEVTHQGLAVDIRKSDLKGSFLGDVQMPYLSLFGLYWPRVLHIPEL